MVRPGGRMGKGSFRERQVLHLAIVSKKAQSTGNDATKRYEMLHQSEKSACRIPHRPATIPAAGHSTENPNQLIDSKDKIGFVCSVLFAAESRPHMHKAAQTRTITHNDAQNNQRIAPSPARPLPRSAATRPTAPPPPDRPSSHSAAGPAAPAPPPDRTAAHPPSPPGTHRNPAYP
jgi:hypothetical protein